MATEKTTKRSQIVLHSGPLSVSDSPLSNGESGQRTDKPNAHSDIIDGSSPQVGVHAHVVDKSCDG